MSNKQKKQLVPKPIKDSDLIYNIKQGDLNAFRSLVDKYKDSISNVVIGLLGNTPEAEEVGQEVFLRFFYKIDNFRLESSLKTYLTRIAINLSLNELKRRKKNKERFIYSEDFKYEKESAENNDYEKKDLIEKALQMLKPSLRAVVILRLMEGYSTKETASILKIPSGTVLSRLSRAQEKLRFLLKNLK